MNVLVVICFAVSTVLAAIAALYAPPAPPRFNLMSGALAFLALGFTIQHLALPG